VLIQAIQGFFQLANKPKHVFDLHNLVVASCTLLFTIHHAKKTFFTSIWYESCHLVVVRAMFVLVVAILAIELYMSS
jgi:hypothetical protein